MEIDISKILRDTVRGDVKPESAIKKIDEIIKNKNWKKLYRFRNIS